MAHDLRAEIGKNYGLSWFSDEQYKLISPYLPHDTGGTPGSLTAALSRGRKHLADGTEHPRNDHNGATGADGIDAEPQDKARRAGEIGAAFVIDQLAHRADRRPGRRLVNRIDHLVMAALVSEGVDRRIGRASSRLTRWPVTLAVTRRLGRVSRNQSRRPSSQRVVRQRNSPAERIAISILSILPGSG